MIQESKEGILPEVESIIEEFLDKFSPDNFLSENDSAQTVKRDNKSEDLPTVYDITSTGDDHEINDIPF